MCDTPSHGRDHLWLIWKESIQICRCYRADTAGGTDERTDGQTDGRTDGVKPIYPPTTSLFRGYKKCPDCSLKKTDLIITKSNLHLPNNWYVYIQNFIVIRMKSENTKVFLFKLKFDHIFH